jgi:hypothetical protein
MLTFASLKPSSQVATICLRNRNKPASAQRWEPSILSQKMHQGDHLSMWDHDLMEHEIFMANHKIKPTSTKSNIYVLRYGLKGQPDCNKSSFISLVPYEGKSGKRTLGTRSASGELLAVALLVLIFPGDFLGIFAGRLRYTDQKPPRSIPGPVPIL